ncbi:aldo/keto reductase [Phanerochaete sordida]|uniref:Aldo/keto reductase n=1 Tax=Phanerochaete sordida TaxID=48140 RepID=A0A9P3LL54_9APHY|nr:aldo/keto reductase [Phanerochaete sordida]
MADIPRVTMNNGLKMPSVGLGCWLGLDGGPGVAEEMCRNALKHGYRHIDTATGYFNEELVGKAIRESGVPRSEIFLTTKLWCSHFGRVREAFEDSLKAFGLDYIDLYLMHFPQRIAEDNSRAFPFEEHPNFVDVWAEMEKLLGTGKVRAIGVSNFSVMNLEILLQSCTVVPATNQVEAHPCLPQHDLQAYCEAKGIVLSAYSPLGQGNPAFFSDPDFLGVAQAHGATPAQVAISWLVQRGVPTLVKSANVERMKANITLLKLTPDEMRVVNELHTKPGAHRSLVKGFYWPDGTVNGWTFEQLGWPLTEGGLVKA